MLELLKHFFAPRRPKPQRSAATPIAPPAARGAGYFRVVNRFTGVAHGSSNALPTAIFVRRRLNCGRKYHPFTVVDRDGRTVTREILRRFQRAA